VFPTVRLVQSWLATGLAHVSRSSPHLGLRPTAISDMDCSRPWSAVDRGRPQLTTVQRSNTEEKMLSRILDDSRWGAQIRPVFYSRNSSNSLYFLASYLAPRIMMINALQVLAFASESTPCLDRPAFHQSPQPGERRQ
jgi:hypothetical protein